MRIIVTSRYEIERMEFKDPCLIISVSTPPDPGPELETCIMLFARTGARNGIAGIHRTQFRDVDPQAIAREGEYRGDAFDPMTGEPITPKMLIEESMSLAQAQDILESVDFWKRQGIDLFYIHCDAGHSRSPGIATALCRIYGLDERDFGPENGKQPNQHVISLIMRAHRDPKGI